MSGTELFTEHTVTAAYPVLEGKAENNMAEIIIDTYQCSGCETCAEMCPDVFYIDEATEKAALVTASPRITDAVRQTAAYCPEKCIEILE